MVDEGRWWVAAARERRRICTVEVSNLSVAERRSELSRTHHDGILILDFGSQYTQLIARRVREAHVYCEIHPPTRTVEWIRDWNPRASSSPAARTRSTTRASPPPIPRLLELGTPVLASATACS